MIWPKGTTVGMPDIPPPDIDPIEHMDGEPEDD
jgi:hypothetical protein